MPITPGESIEPVEARNQADETVGVSFERPTVLFFYPEDGSPGCTTEAKQFEREGDVYEESGVAVYGVSRDDVDSHRAFHEDLGLSFDLLADPDGEVADRLGIDRQPGGEYDRTTVVAVDGEVWRVYEGVSADGHARNVLSDLLDADVVELEF
jgi:peroxiredoxin Q/BCP